MRQAGIDVMRVVATFGVIALHTKPFEHYGDHDKNYLFLLTNQGARFAVPYFFAIAGYLWMEKIKHGYGLDRQSRPYVVRILKIFAFWCCVYGILGGVSPGTVVNEGVAGLVSAAQAFGSVVWKDPWTLLFQGSRGHLWFLPALMCAVVITATFFRMQWYRWLLPAAGGLYLLSLMGGAYATTAVGLAFPFASYLGPLVGTLFFAIGAEISLSGWRTSMTAAVLLFLSGMAGQVLESWWLWRDFHVQPVTQEQLISTVPMGIGAAAVALAWPVTGKGVIVSRWGPYMLGVYVAHPLVMDAFRVIDGHGILWDLVFPMLVFGCTLSLVMLGARFKFMKPMLM
jgi:surface polysaccharide O-acyltransferase-like enzyme